MFKAKYRSGLGRYAQVAAGATLAAASCLSHASTYQPAGIDLGATTFNDAFGSLAPGWTSIQLLQYEHNDKFYDNSGKNPGTFQNPSLNATMWLPQLIYTSPFHVLGGALGFTALLPVVDLNGNAGPDGQALTAKSGIGDITLGSFLQFAPVISGGRPVFVQRFEFDVIAPTGAYDPTRLVNPGSNFWSLNPYWSMTWLPTPRTEISARLHYLYNFKNTNPGNNLSDGPQFAQADPFVIQNFQAGQAVWANFGASYKVLPNLEVGLNGFWFRQITDDKVDGIRQTADRTANLSLGPGAELTIGHRDFVFANIYLPVVERNTDSGFHMNLRWIHAF